MVQLCAAIWHQCLTTSIIRFPISPQDWSLQATNLHKYSQKPHAKYCFGDKRHYTVALWILFQHYLCNTCTLVTAYVRSSRPTSHTYRDFSAKHTKKNWQMFKNTRLHQARQRSCASLQPNCDDNDPYYCYFFNSFKNNNYGTTQPWLSRKRAVKCVHVCAEKGAEKSSKDCLSCWLLKLPQ